jgi:hypothetical protein
MIRSVTMRTIAAIALALLCISASPGTSGQTSDGSSPAPSPAPKSTKCWIYDAIYPVTRSAFESQHVTRAEQLEILKWARPASPAQTKLVKGASPWATPPSVNELGLVRWIRVGSDSSVDVFVARPLFKAGSTGHWPWVALNTNEFIDPVLCDTGAYPTE